MVRVDTTYDELRQQYEAETLALFAPIFADILADARNRRPIAERWAPVLAPTVLRQMTTVADDIGSRVAYRLGDRNGTMWARENMQPWLRQVAGSLTDGELAAIDRNLAALTEALEMSGGDPIKAYVQDAQGRMVRSTVHTPANFAANDAAQATGADTKMWLTRSSNPRMDHAVINGEMQPVGVPFSIGLQYPRAGGPPEQTANCMCTMVLIKREV